MKTYRDFYVGLASDKDLAHSYPGIQTLRGLTSRIQRATARRLGDGKTAPKRSS